MFRKHPDQILADFEAEQGLDVSFAFESTVSILVREFWNFL